MQVEVELTTVSSNYHVELTPSDAGLKDRYVIQEIIKEMAKSRPLDVAAFVAGAGHSNTGDG
jgi:replication factor C subunit 3/5